MRPLKVFIIAGEASGDALGAKLLHALKLSESNVQFEGIGGDRMRAEGLNTLFPMNELSIMGFAEIVPHIPHLLKRINQTVERIEEVKPDVVVTIDSPGFCCRVAKKLREAGTKAKLVHYVAPTVWAYKPERAKKMAELFDHLMVLLPFEPPFFEAENLPCSFVGHSIVEEPIAEGDGESFRRMYGIDKEAKVLCVLSGSRKSETSRLLPIFADVIRNLAQKETNLAVVFPTLPSVAKEVQELAETLPIKTVVVKGAEKKYDAYAACDVALAKSGTATLEVAKAGIPMVVTYKVNPISAWLMKRMMKVRFVNLINLLLDREVIPECLQEDCNVKTLTERLEALLLDDSVRGKQLQAANEAFAMLGEGEAKTPSEKAVEVIRKITGRDVVAVPQEKAESKKKEVMLEAAL